MNKLKTWLPVFIWAAVIFSLSSRPVIQSSKLYVFDFIIKKTAHIVEYAVLFFLLSRTNKQKSFYKTAFLIGLFYAFTDEIHQTFVPGRGAKLTDVLIFDQLGLLLSWRFLSRKK